jgi:hypothetical protein
VSVIREGEPLELLLDLAGQLEPILILDQHHSSLGPEVLSQRTEKRIGDLPVAGGVLEPGAQRGHGLVIVLLNLEEDPVDPTADYLSGGVE